MRRAGGRSFVADGEACGELWREHQYRYLQEHGSAMQGGNGREIVTRVKVTPEGWIKLPADIRKRHGLAQGVEVLVEETDDAIVLRTFDQVLAHAQAMSRRLAAGRTSASVEDFLAERQREADAG
jgi:AbrB family looped-hinge helix DNA binding protein